MLDEIIDSHDLRSKAVSFEKGQAIFSEGDTSQDLYLLVSGEIEISKGDKVLTATSEKGALFGEMSFLLNAPRTATVRAKTSVKAVCVPKEQITDFLTKYTQVASIITKNLAQRLDQTSQVLYGLRELCDQIPDALIITDPEYRIISWNKAAEELYGISWDDIKGRRLHQIYSDQEEAERSFEGIGPGSPSRTNTLKVQHQSKGERVITTVTKALMDSRGVFHGMISSARDVSEMEEFARKYRRIKSLIVPLFLLIALITGAAFYGYNYLSPTTPGIASVKKDLQEKMAKDYLNLFSLLDEPLRENNLSAISRIIRDFVVFNENGKGPYKGLVLLDSHKKVIDAYLAGGDYPAADVKGESYSGIPFNHNESAHAVLTLYRVTPRQPMGERIVEAAFMIKSEGRISGWIVFQMNMKTLKERYSVDQAGLEKMHFEAIDK
jgi:PAS domain S-box-containing protein